MAAPNCRPSPSAASMRLPKWATLMTNRVNPAATRRSICHTMSGLPPASRSGFGSASDNGRMRSPRPAARIIAIIGSSEAVTDRRLPRLELVEQAKQWRELVVAGAGAAQIAHHARHFLQVRVLSIAMIEPCEDAQHLELTLHAHPFEVSPERAEIRCDRQPARPRPLPVARRPVDLQRFVPFDVSIAQQRDQVVGNRSENGILEIQYAWIRIADHQVAGMVIAMHVDARLREVVVEYAPESVA